MFSDGSGGQGVLGQEESLERASTDSQDIKRCASLSVDGTHGLAHPVISNRRNSGSHQPQLCNGGWRHLEAVIQQHG